MTDPTTTRYTIKRDASSMTWMVVDNKTNDILERDLPLPSSAWYYADRHNDDERIDDLIANRNSTMMEG